MDTLVNQTMKMDPKRKVVVEWIDHILDRKNITATDLARNSGLAVSTLTRLLNDEKYTFVPSLKTLQKIAEGSGYPIPRKVTDLLGAPRMEPPAKKTMSTMPNKKDVSYIPVASQHTVELRYVSSLPASLQSASAKVSAPVPAPPQIEDDETAFAFHMPDDVFDPWIKAGSLMFATKRRDPVGGDIVMITDNNGKTKVRLLIGIDESGLRLSKTMPVSDTDVDVTSFDDIKDIAIVTIITKI